MSWPALVVFFLAYGCYVLFAVEESNLAHVFLWLFLQIWYMQKEVQERQPVHQSVASLIGMCVAIVAGPLYVESGFAARRAPQTITNVEANLATLCIVLAVEGFLFQLVFFYNRVMGMGPDF